VQQQALVQLLQQAVVLQQVVVVGIEVVGLVLLLLQAALVPCLVS
jgi:hypothetical protein